MIEIPRFETDRLILRGLEQGDLDAYAAMMGDPEVTRYLGDGKPLSRSDAWRQMAMFNGHWLLLGFGMWAVEEKNSGQFLGRVGCLEPEGWPAFEIGYSLSRVAWGNGFAREAAAFSLHYAREVLRRTEIVSFIRPLNAASIRVATALGAVEAETIELFGASTAVFRYPVSAG